MLTISQHTLGNDDLSISWEAYIVPANDIIGYYFSDENNNGQFFSDTAMSKEDGIVTFVEPNQYLEHGKLIEYNEWSHFRLYYTHSKQRLKFFVNGELIRTTSIVLDNKSWYFYCYIPDQCQIRNFEIRDETEVGDIYYDDHSVAYLPFNNSLADPCGNVWSLQGQEDIRDLNTPEPPALQLNGTSYVQCNNYITIGGQDFTIEGYCYLSQESNRQARIFSIYDRDMTGEVVALVRRQETDYLTLVVAENREEIYHTGGLGYHSNSKVINKIVHFAVVYNYLDCQISLFLDGKLDCQGTCPQLERKAYCVRLGAKYDGYHYMVGTIDEFRISDIARYSKPTNILSLLYFNSSTIEDEIEDNVWEEHNKPTLTQEHTYQGKSLRCAGSGISLTSQMFIGGNDFTIDFWSFTDLKGKRPTFFEITSSWETEQQQIEEPEDEKPEILPKSINLTWSEINNQVKLGTLLEVYNLGDYKEIEIEGILGTCHAVLIQCKNKRAYFMITKNNGDLIKGVIP